MKIEGNGALLLESVFFLCRSNSYRLEELDLRGILHERLGLLQEGLDVRRLHVSVQGLLRLPMLDHGVNFA